MNRDLLNIFALRLTALIILPVVAWLFLLGLIYR